MGIYHFERRLQYRMYRLLASNRRALLLWICYTRCCFNRSSRDQGEVRVPAVHACQLSSLARKAVLSGRSTSAVEVDAPSADVRILVEAFYSKTLELRCDTLCPLLRAAVALQSEELIGACVGAVAAPKAGAKGMDSIDIKLGRGISRLLLCEELAGIKGLSKADRKSLVAAADGAASQIAANLDAALGLVPDTGEKTYHN